MKNATVKKLHGRQAPPVPEETGLSGRVSGVMADMLGDVSSINLQIYGKVELLARLIDRMKGDIGRMRQGEPGRCDLSSATDELDAVVSDSATAAGTILEAAEAMEDVAGRCDAADRAKLQAAAAHIYEACSFQDLSGQRITKVVRALRQVESGLQLLLRTFGGPHPEPANGAPKGDAALLNGPQLPSKAQSQDEIDALLASFG